MVLGFSQAWFQLPYFIIPISTHALTSFCAGVLNLKIWLLKPYRTSSSILELSGLEFVSFMPGWRTTRNKIKFPFSHLSIFMFVYFYVCIFGITLTRGFRWIFHFPSDAYNHKAITGVKYYVKEFIPIWRIYKQFLIKWNKRIFLVLYHPGIGIQLLFPLPTCLQKKNLSVRIGLIYWLCHLLLDFN